MIQSDWMKYAYHMKPKGKMSYDAFLFQASKEAVEDLRKAADKAKESWHKTRALKENNIQLKIGLSKP